MIKRCYTRYIIGKYLSLNNDKMIVITSNGYYVIMNKENILVKTKKITDITKFIRGYRNSLITITTCVMQ